MAAVSEIAAECGGCSYASRRGYWMGQGGDCDVGAYVGRELLVVTDVADTAAKKDWFASKKLTWKGQLNQCQMYVSSYVIDWL